MCTNNANSNLQDKDYQIVRLSFEYGKIIHNERILKKIDPHFYITILSQVKTNGAGAETYVSAGIGPDFVAGFSGSEDAAAAGFSGSEDADSVEDSVIATLR